MELIKGFCILLSCQFLGEVIGRALSLPVPGPVLGMLILLLGLMARGRMRKRLLSESERQGPPAQDMGQRQLGRALLRERVPSSLRLASNGLLAHLSLLFVPAGVGVMVHFGLIERDLLAIVVTLIVSIGVTQLVTAWLLQRLIDRRKPPQANADESAGEVSS